MRDASPRNIIMIIVILILLAIPGTTLAGQNQAAADSRVNYWMNVGLGVGSHGFAGNISGNLQYKSFLMTIHYSGDAELFGNDYDEYGILFGAALKRARFLLSGAAGIASVGGNVGGGLFTTPTKLPRVIGVPFECQLFYRPFKFFGVGLCGFALLNKYSTFYGATLSIQFGDLR